MTSQFLKALWLLCACVLTAASQRVTVLPRFSLSMTLDRSDFDRQIFHNDLEDMVHEHLEEFFDWRLGGLKTESNSDGNGISTSITLSASLMWENGQDEAQQNSEAADGDKSRSKTTGEYSAWAHFDSLLSTSLKQSEVSDAILELLLIEAFQGDNYDNLLNAILEKESLQGIEEMDVSVHADGYDGSGPQKAGKWSQPQDAKPSPWTSTTTIGLCAAGFFFILLSTLWTYLHFFANRRLLAKENDDRSSSMLKHETSTDVTSSDNGQDDSDADSNKSQGHENDRPTNEERWMDAWAKSMTSISIREPARPKKKKQKCVPRPAARQSLNSVLSMIEEADGDESTCASSVASKHSQSSRSRKAKKAAAKDDLVLSKADTTYGKLQSIEEDAQQPVNPTTVLNAIAQLSINEMFHAKPQTPQEQDDRIEDLLPDPSESV